MKVILKKAKFEELLARANMSQQDFAEKIDTSESYLTMLKSKNPKSPSPKFRKKIMEALQVDFDDIFFVISSCNNDNIEEVNLLNATTKS